MPTFDERLKIIDDKIDKANNLNTIFNIATVLLKLNKFDVSKNFMMQYFLKNSIQEKYIII